MSSSIELYYSIIYYIILMRTFPLQESIQHTNIGSSVTVIGGKDCPPLNDSGLGIVNTNIP